MSKNKSLKFLISRSFALLLIGFLFEVHGQVPVNDLPAAPAPSTGLVGAPEEFDDLGLGVLADPVGKTSFTRSGYKYDFGYDSSAHR